MKKILQLVVLGAILAISCSGCVMGVDQYGRPVAYPLEVVSYPAYPVDVYPYYWDGYYYYPFWNGSVWNYNIYTKPIPNWVGPPLRHSGPAPMMRQRQIQPQPQQRQFQPQYRPMAPATTPKSGGKQYKRYDR